MQTLLNNKKASLDVDGIYGNKTLHAIIAFQRSVGLSGDGLIEPGKATWQALQGSEGDASASASSGAASSAGTPPGVIPDKLKDVEVKALVPNIPYMSQLDNARNPNATCNVSSCAMALKSVNPDLFPTDDAYHQALIPYLSNPNDTTAHGPHTQMLADKGVRSYFSQTLTYDDVKASLDAGKAVVIGVKHRGTLAAPRGSHMIAVVGYYNGGFICNDPYGNSFSYDSDDGQNCKIPYESLDARWQCEGPGSGWGRIFE